MIRKRTKKTLIKMSVSSTEITNLNSALTVFHRPPLDNGISNSNSINEIEEEVMDEANRKRDDGGRLASIREDYFERSSDVVSLNGDDIVYVGVGKSESSMDALSWTLRHAVNPSSTVIFLIHVFPVTRFVPYPLGKLPKNQASPEQLESYMAQERGKRRELLHKFINACSLSKVRVETALIESDVTAKAIQDLIPILNIRKLVLGISKSNARKLKGRRRNGIVEQILKGCAIESCEVKVICEGKEVMVEQMMESPPPLGGDGADADDNPRSPREQHQPSDLPAKKDQPIDPLACLCFINKPKTND